MRASWALFISLNLIGLSAATDALAASAGDATAKPKVSGAGGATIYFVRAAGIKGFWVPDIVVDNQKIGALLPASVLVAHRPAGHHSIVIPAFSILSGSLHSEIDVTAGQTYYLELGPYADAPGTQLLMALMSAGAGARGKMLPGSGGSSWRFYQLDADAGRELIAKAKSAAH
jgi:hypothetical protein